jgi:uncharacterized membrane protein YccC
MPDVTGRSREGFLEEELLELQGDLDAARENGSWQAVAALHRQLRSVRDDLDALRASTGDVDELEALDETEYLAQLEIGARGWPPQHRQVVVAVHLEIERLPSLEDLVASYIEHHGQLRVLQGGKE